MYNISRINPAVSCFKFIMKWLFESILRDVDAIEISGLPSGNIRFGFALQGAFVELK